MTLDHLSGHPPAFAEGDPACAKAHTLESPNEPAKRTRTASQGVHLATTSDSAALQTYLTEMAHYRLLTHEETLVLAETMSDAKEQMRDELARVPHAAREAIRLCRDWLDRGRPLSQLIDTAPHGAAARYEERSDSSSEKQRLLSRIDTLERRSQQWERRQTEAARKALTLAFRTLYPNIHLLRKVEAACKDIALQLAPERAVGAAQALQRLEDAAGTDRATLDEVCRKVRNAETRYSQAWKRMVQANLRLVVSVVRRFGASPVALEDLIQEGNTGLFRAVEKYDHRLGYRFSTYASFWIRQAVTRAFVNQGRTMRVPAHMNDKIVKLAQVHNGLRQQLGRRPTPRELARHSELPLETVQLALKSAQANLSLDSPIGQDQSGTLQDIIGDAATRPAEDIGYVSELRRVIGSLLQLLPPREALILRLRNGIGGTEAMNLEQIADVIGVSRERVRQLEARAMMTLRGHIESQAPDLADGDGAQAAHDADNAQP